MISFASRILNDTERKYCTTRRELLAVVTFVKYFRHFLWGRHFKIRTDHASLVWLKNFKNPEGILARWITVLDTYDFSLEHRKGKLHTNADSLTRKPRGQCHRSDYHDCSNTGILKQNKHPEDNNNVVSACLSSKRILKSDQVSSIPVEHTDFDLGSGSGQVMAVDLDHRIGYNLGQMGRF